MEIISSFTPTGPCCCTHFGPQLSRFAKNSIFAFPSFKNRNPIFNFTARNDGGEAKASFGVVGENDLLIVGPGVLGRLVAEKWREDYPGCQVYGQTMTTDHHDELIKVGINPSLNWTKTHQFPYVIFCAPPSRTSDYPGDVRIAALSWNGEGSFLFTSSSAPYDCSDNGPCNEDTPVVPIGRSPRTDVLLKAEQVVLEFGGCVVRLAGLYKADRGAHTYWLKKGTVEVRPDHILNLIHYEDAASLSVTILKKKFRGRIFLGCDNHPRSRQEIMNLVNRSGKFNKKFEAFTVLSTRQQKNRRRLERQQRSAMGKICCEESDNGLDLTGIVMVIIIALAFMAICLQPRRPRLLTVYRCRSCCWSPCRC